MINAIDLAWLGVLRHGESTGNVAAARAEATGADALDIDTPDHATGLTEHGRAQATTVGAWFAGLPADQRPDQIIASPYLRAAQTAEVVAAAVGVDVRLDERLRDRELGVLDRLTQRGVIRQHPLEAARRAHLGRFYHRPPGGESWADVAQRLRDHLAQYRVAAAGQRILIVTHEAVITLCRYIIEGLTVAQADELSRRPTANVGLTSWEHRDGALVLAGYDDTTPAQAMATRQPNV